MMGTAMQWQAFIQGLFWGLILFGIGPKFIKEVVEKLKRPAAGTADQVKTSNYNISEFRNIHNLERWE